LLIFCNLQYEKASIDFSNIDVMIGATMNFQAWDMVDVRTVFGPRFHRVNMFYSNPDYYVEQKRLESKTIRWPVKTDDFFPYSDCPHCFWTGYFTSRTAFKRYERVASSLLLAARQIDSLYGGFVSSAKKTTTTKQESPLFPLEDALGVAQHHDAISGTAKQHVADDYSFRLSVGVDQAVQHVSSILREAMFAIDDVTTSTRIDELVYCPLLNETKCPVSEVGRREMLIDNNIKLLTVASFVPELLEFDRRSTSCRWLQPIGPRAVECCSIARFFPPCHIVLHQCGEIDKVSIIDDPIIRFEPKHIRIDLCLGEYATFGSGFRHCQSLQRRSICTSNAPDRHPAAPSQ
jgi:hypothetical protein